MAQTKAVATDAPELTISPDALAAMAKAMSEATLAVTQREVNSPPPTNALGFQSKDVPALTYSEVYYCGAPQTTQWLTPAEVRLYNAITVPGTYGPDKTWEVRIKENKLHVLIHGVNKREVRLELPRKLTEILQTIVDEQNAVAA